VELGVNHADLQQEKRRLMMSMTSGPIMTKIVTVGSGIFKASLGSQKDLSGRVVSAKGMMRDANIQSIKRMRIQLSRSRLLPRHIKERQMKSFRDLRN